MINFKSITCSEANEICNKAQYNEASLLEKVKLTVHISLCKVCSLYSKQNKILTQTFKHKAADCKIHRHTLNDEEKKKFEEELKKHFK